MNKCKDCIHVRLSGDFELKDSGGVTYDAKHCNKLNAYFILEQKACDDFEQYLKPCPHCGEKESLNISPLWVGCDSCKTFGPDATDEMSSTEAWNRRTK